MPAAPVVQPQPLEPLPLRVQHRCRSGHRPCAPRTRRTRSRARAHHTRCRRPGRRPRRMPRPRRTPAMAATGAPVPSAFDAWCTATSRVRSVTRSATASKRGEPSASCGSTRTRARLRHGSRLEWCSAIETMTSSSGRSPSELAGGEVRRLGGAAGEDGSRRRRRRGARRPRGGHVGRFARLGGQSVHAAVHVGGALFVVAANRSEHGARLRRRRCRVEVGDALAVEFARGRELRELRARRCGRDAHDPSPHEFGHGDVAGLTQTELAGGWTGRVRWRRSAPPARSPSAGASAARRLARRVHCQPLRAVGTRGRARTLPVRAARGGSAAARRRQQRAVDVARAVGRVPSAATTQS